MAQGPAGRPAVDATELERLRAKLDGFEAMGLQVGPLRELLASDPEAFKSTYMAEIRRQLEGAPASSAPPQAPTRLPEEVEVRVGPPSEEQIEEELELEGAGPEEALTAPPASAEGARAVTMAAMPAMPAGTVIAAPVKGPVPPAAQATTEAAQVQRTSGEVETASEEPEAASEDLRSLKAPLKEADREREEVKGDIEEQKASKPEAPVEPTGAGKVAQAMALQQAAVDYTIMTGMQAQQEGAAGDKQTMKDLIDELEEGIEDEFDEAADAAEIDNIKVSGPEIEAGAGRAVKGGGPEATSVGPEAVEGFEGTGSGEGIDEDFSDIEVGEAAGFMEDDGSRAFEVRTIDVGETTPAVPEVGRFEGAEPEEEAAGGAAEGPSEEEVAGAEAPAEQTGAEAEAEAEAEAQARVKPPRTPRRRPGRAFFATAAVAIIVVAGLAGYFTFFANDPPFASFTYTPETPVAGQVVTFDASASRDPDGDGIGEYRWTFGDTRVGKGRIVKHTFNTSDEFTVTLKVVDGRGAASRPVRQSLAVEPLRVEMSRPHVGDDYRYEVLAYISASNPEGLYHFSSTLPGGLDPITIVVKQVRARLAGAKSSTVDGTASAEDGFMRQHAVREETTTYNLDDVQGEVLTNLAAADTSLDGYINATLEDKVCLGWDRTIKTDVDIDAKFMVPPNFMFTERDTGTFYPQLEGIASSFSLASFLRSTEFDSEDRSSHEMQVGDGTYIWRVRGMEVVEGRTQWGLHVNVTMSQQTLGDAGLDAFYTDVWLEPGLSQPAKSHVHTKAYSEGNTVIVDVTETLVSSTNGVADPGTGCPADHAYTVQGEFTDDFAPLDPVPVQGGVGGGFAFTPDDAVEAASRQLTGFQTWLDGHPSAFCHDGNYSTQGGEATWRLSFGTMGSSEHFGITVRGPPAALTATGASYIDDGSPLGSAAGIGPVVTLSRGIHLLRNQTDVRTNAFRDSNPDWTRFNLTIGEGAQSMPLDPTAIGSPSGAGYVYVLESHDDALSDKGHYRAGLDATNGQVLFSWTQKQARTGSIGGAG